MLLNGTGDRIDELDYPLTTDDLAAELAGDELELPGGSERLPEVLERLGSETFETAEDARFAVFTGVSEKAIGRKGYSDRDPTPVGSRLGPDQVSF
jgi:hypothetical protein